MLLGKPLAPSTSPRLASLSKKLGNGSISVLIDHSDQLHALRVFKEVCGHHVKVFVKIDTAGYQRAGLPPEPVVLDPLLDAIFAAEAEELCHLEGLYSHAGNSYSGSAPKNALEFLEAEIGNSLKAVDIVKQHPGYAESPRNLVLTVGATPTATVVTYLSPSSHSLPEDDRPELSVVHGLMNGLLEIPNLYLELHAGVYTLFDRQQTATQVTRMGEPDYKGAVGYDLALTIIAEVISIYPDRSPPEVLIAAGTLALGREPCPGSKTWAAVVEWDIPGRPHAQRLVSSEWEVHKISQEHGVLRANSGTSESPECGDNSKSPIKIPWTVGQKVRMWPNHACVAGAMYDQYVVVDGDVEGGERVVDVWSRCRGW